MKILLGESCRRRLAPTEEGSGMAGCRVDGNSRSEKKRKACSSQAMSFSVFPIPAQSSKGGEKDRRAEEEERGILRK